jgi:hypothetical protein
MSFKQKLNTVMATVTMPVSVTSNGNVEKPNDVAVRRNGPRYRNRLRRRRVYEP